MTGLPNRRLRLLFVARAYPPTLGGMETLAQRLAEGMAQRADVVTLINRRGKKALPVFLPYAFASAIYLARKHRVHAIHLADALLAPFGRMLKRVTGVPVTVSVCGLDVTYSSRLYQALVPPSLASLDMTMPISRATEQQVRERAGLTTPSTVIPLGVNSLETPDEAALQAFRELACLCPGESTVLTVGRLVKRKGVAWFVEHVLPRLDNVTYVAIGEGPEAAAIEAAASAAGVAGRLRLLGRVPGRLLAAAYHEADVMVMPNVPVPGDMEGFGLVALEASASGLPVVASRLEGITEAVQNERNGFLVPAQDPHAYVDELRRLLSLPRERLRAIGEAQRDFTVREYSWRRTAERYLQAIERVASASNTLPEAA